MDTAEPGLNTAALATVYPAHANPITAPRPTGPVVQTGAIQRVIIQALARKQTFSPFPISLFSYSPSVFLSLSSSPGGKFAANALFLCTQPVAAQSTGTVARARNFVGRDYATPGSVIQIWEARALMESVAPALRGTRLVLEPSLETAAR